MYRIERLDAEGARFHTPGLVALLEDAIESGASLGFLPPLSEETMADYWHSIIDEVAHEVRVLLVALESEQVIGSVQLAFASKANGAHRAEVQKLCVLRSARNRGVAGSLMSAAEEAAIASGRSLLVLDTRKGDPAEQLYLKLGYTCVGVIPRYTRTSEGEFRDGVFFYTLIGQPE